MATGNHEKVAGCVRKAIKNDEIVAPPGQNVVFTILINRKNRTENTIGRVLG